MAGLTCPWCGTEHDLHDARDPQRRPMPGDTSICSGCLGIGVFESSAGGLTIRRANRAEAQMILKRPDVRSGLEALWHHLGHPVGDAVDAWRNHEAEGAEETQDTEHPEQHQ